MDSNSVSSNAGDTMDNTHVDMTEGTPKMNSDEASSEVTMPGTDSTDADVDADSTNE